MTTSAPRFTPFRGSIAGLCVPLSNASLRPRGSPTVAVGTALSGGPPHRSQRAELPHWAPRSGPTPVHSSTNRRTRSSTLDAPVPALCPEHVVLAAFPSRCPLPSTISAAAQRPCSTASPVLRGSPTSHAVHLGLAASAFPERPAPFPAGGQCGISRFSRMKIPYMHRFSDRAGSAGDSRITPPAMLPSACHDDVGTPIHRFRGSIAWPARTPVNASLRPRGSPTVAVGTALSGGPPHRSQRAELPHWAPRSGPTPVHSSTNRRTRSSTLDAPVPALCPEHVVLAAFPSRCPLPSTISAAAQRPCSTASPVL